MSFNVDEEVAMMSRVDNEKQRMAEQQRELDQLPKAIDVTYVGDNLSGYSHKGRSRVRSNDPYRFYQNIPIRITDPVDVKYFLRRTSDNFDVKVVDGNEVAQPITPKVEEVSAPTVDPEIEAQKKKAEEIMEKQKEEAKAEEVKVEEAKVEEDSSEALEETGLSLKIRNRIVDAGYDSLDKIANAKIEDLIEIEGVGQVTAEKIQATAIAKLNK